jgi:hypothetical protein
MEGLNMKNKFISLLLALPMLGLACSCSEKELAPAAPSGDKVQLQFNRPATRTVYDGAGNGSWCDSDKVAVWASNGASGKFIEFTASDASRGLFEGTVDEGYTVGGVAVYPSVIAAGFDGKNVTLTLPDEYTVTEQTTNLPLAGWFTSPDDPVTLNAVGSAIEISYANVPPDAAAMRFTASSDIAGSFTLAEGDRIAASLANGNTVTVNFTAPVSAENKVTFYVPVPAGEYTTAPRSPFWTATVSKSPSTIPPASSTSRRPSPSARPASSGYQPSPFPSTTTVSGKTAAASP